MAKTSTHTLPSWEVPPALVKSTKPIYGFYVTYGQRFMFQHFAALYAAKAFINLMLQGDDYTRVDDFNIKTARGVSIRIENPTGRKGPSLFDTVLNYQMTPQEQEFEFPERLLSAYRPFPNSPLLTSKPQQSPNDETPDNDQQTPTKATQRAPKPAQPARKPKPEGLVTVASIADELKIDAKQARQALRKAKIDKPEHGWAFTPDQVPAITAAIKEHLK